MKFCFCNARQSAPTDGRDASTNQQGQSIFLTSKQNSDAKGLFYQWGHKDPFTFATSSQQWGGDRERGMYPVKIYTIDGVLIYQENNGGDNINKQPVGGIIVSLTKATSMMETIKNPIMFYYADGSIINQVGHTKTLWDYYWTSYSRGVDGNRANTKWHNNYLNAYTTQRQKSIYDPCPYGFVIPSNGTYNDYRTHSGWVYGNYARGWQWNINTGYWFVGHGGHNVKFDVVGSQSCIWTSMVFNEFSSYWFALTNAKDNISWSYPYSPIYGMSVRCIEERYRYF